MGFFTLPDFGDHSDEPTKSEDAAISGSGECKHKWYGYPGIYISSGTPGRSVSTEGYYACIECGLVSPGAKPPEDV